MDLRQTKEFAQHLKLINWRVEKIGQDYIFIRPIPLTPFSIIKFQRPKKIDFKRIDQVAKKHRAITIYLEPTSKIKPEHGYRQSKTAFLPTKTIQLDLAQSEEKILKQMKKDARYCLKKAQKNNLKIVKEKNLKKFRQAWKKAVGWQKHVPSLKSLNSFQITFGPKAIFLTTTHQGKIIAGTVILTTNKAAYYYYAFTSKKGRKKLAQYLVVWETIKTAKKKRCGVFDFEGIYDKRLPFKSWQGFSHFKKGFGGKEKKYPKCSMKHRFPF